MFASYLYSSQALLLCKKEMIYRDAGVAVRQVLSRVVGTGDKRNESFIIEEERINEEIHPDNYTRLSLDGLQPSTAVFDRWRLYKIHHFAIVAEDWRDLTSQVNFDHQRLKSKMFQVSVYRNPCQRGQDALDSSDGKQVGERTASLSLTRPTNDPHFPGGQDPSQSPSLFLM